MKVFLFPLFLCYLAVKVAGDHTFVGTSVGTRLVMQTQVKYPLRRFEERVDYFNYTLPFLPTVGKYIQGILAYDLRNTRASANITAGGLGTNFVKLRMKSEKGKATNYDIYIYA